MQNVSVLIENGPKMNSKEQLGPGRTVSLYPDGSLLFSIPFFLHSVENFYILHCEMMSVSHLPDCVKPS